MELTKELKRKGKWMSKLLRHDPGDLKMDESGWVNCNELRKLIEVTSEDLDLIVENNNKKRFEFDQHKIRIRARQGHSINVDVELKQQKPPRTLYHGTSTKYYDKIKKEGVKKMSRNHVHLSKDYDTAVNVGSRHGKPIVLEIDAWSMHEDGEIFYLSNNGVWLTEHISPEYIL